MHINRKTYEKVCYTKRRSNKCNIVIYKAVKPGSRAKDYELALSWLVDCGLVHQVFRASKPGIPLKAYEDNSVFKLFISDVGLMAAMGDIDVRTLLEVKAEENLQAKSLKTYCQKYSPGTAIRISMSDFRKEDWMINLPLYAISKLPDMV